MTQTRALFAVSAAAPAIADARACAAQAWLWWHSDAISAASLQRW
jgi:hypothetical protein